MADDGQKIEGHGSGSSPGLSRKDDTKLSPGLGVYFDREENRQSLGEEWRKYIDGRRSEYEIADDYIGDEKEDYRELDSLTWFLSKFWQKLPDGSEDWVVQHVEFVSEPADEGTVFHFRIGDPGKLESQRELQFRLNFDGGLVRHSERSESQANYEESQREWLRSETGWAPDRNPELIEMMSDSGLYALAAKTLDSFRPVPGWQEFLREGGSLLDVVRARGKRIGIPDLQKQLGRRAFNYAMIPQMGQEIHEVEIGNLKPVDGFLHDAVGFLRPQDELKSVRLISFGDGTGLPDDFRGAVIIDVDLGFLPKDLKSLRLVYWLHDSANVFQTGYLAFDSILLGHDSSMPGVVISREAPNKRDEYIHRGDLFEFFMRQRGFLQLMRNLGVWIREEQEH